MPTNQVIKIGKGNPRWAHWIERERDWKKVEIESGVGSDGWGRGLRKRSRHVALWIRRGPWPEWGGRGGQRTSNGGCPLAVPVLGCTNRARLYLCCGRCSALAVNLLSFSFPNSNGGGRWAGAGFFVFFICPFRCLLMAVPESVQWWGCRLSILLWKAVFMRSMPSICFHTGSQSSMEDFTRRSIALCFRCSSVCFGLPTSHIRWNSTSILSCQFFRNKRLTVV